MELAKLTEPMNIEPTINIRKNASIKTKGCPSRRNEVFLISRLGLKRWKQLKDVGRRWIAEIVFSSLKRVLGEEILSKKFKAQKVEAGLKVYYTINSLACKLTITISKKSKQIFSVFQGN